MKKPLEGTKFEFRESNDGVETVCPWGNRITVHEPDVERFGRVALGMPYVRFDVRPGTVERIARFYREVMRRAGGSQQRTAPGREAQGPGRREAVISISAKPTRRRRRTMGDHVQIYLVEFLAGPHRRLADLGLITMEDQRARVPV